MRFAAALVAAGLSMACATSSRFAIREADAAADTSCPASNVRGTDRAILCGRVVNEHTGHGLPGGDVRFVRGDGRSMLGAIERDGTFGINVPGGHGTLTIEWSCRTAVKLVDTLTVPPGRGLVRTFSVPVAPADTMCRREWDDRTDRSRASIARWITRGPCFAIAVEPWDPPLDPGYVPPHWVRLDSLPQAQNAPGSIQPLHHTAGARWPSTGWGPLQGDSLQLYLNKDFTGVLLTLGLSADSLAGQGHWTDDIIETDSLGFLKMEGRPKGTVSARRIPCP